MASPLGVVDADFGERGLHFGLVDPLKVHLSNRQRNALQAVRRSLSTGYVGGSEKE